MTAAAQMLHDYLNVHYAEGACGDVCACACRIDDKACVNALNAQQLIGCLRSGNAYAVGGILAGSNGAAVVYLCCFDKLRALYARFDGDGKSLFTATVSAPSFFR